MFFLEIEDEKSPSKEIQDQTGENKINLPKEKKENFFSKSLNNEIKNLKKKKELFQKMEKDKKS